LLFTIFGVLGLNQPVFSQNYKLNFGLQQPQEPSTLPVAKSAPKTSVRKAKVQSQPALTKVAENEFILSNGWEMAEENKVISAEKNLFDTNFSTSNWYNATVPGTVLTTLVDQGVYPDPYYGLNNMLIPDSLSRKHWWYRLEMPLPEGTSAKRVWLLFNGINYKADIWLNGKLVGNITGAFKRGNFDVTDFLNLEGKNILAVKIYPPNNPGIPHEESARTNHGPNGGQLCLDGPTFISSEGWDWVPGIRDRNIGIWQDVRLRLTDDVVIGDPQVITNLPLPDTTSALVTVSTRIINLTDKPQNINLSGKIGSIEFNKEVLLNPRETRRISFQPNEFKQLNIQNPRLWWPNGYGKPELYDLTLVATTDNGFSDKAEISFGIREFSYDLAVAHPTDSSLWRVEFDPLKAQDAVLFNTIDRVDLKNGTVLPTLAENADISLLKTIEQHSDNPFLTIKVNGVPIFCKGGNWGMDDAMKRVSRERLEPYFRLHKEENFNMIRNWTGESTEEVFYSLADEYGMLVWNDFWLSTEGYNLNVNDNVLFLDNALDVVRRYRNHASIAVWCPRNEGFAPQEIEPKLQEMIAREDGTRYYSPNSRNLNLRPSGPWHYRANAADYFNTIAEGFNSELGSPSIPTAETMKSFIPKEDQWPISDTWYYHDFHEGLEPFVADMEKRYGKATSIDDFARKAQLLNYDSHRAMFESWNSKMWDNASGLLLWMSHPAWPSMVWQTYSWDYETFGSYFGCKKACEPLHIQMNLHDNKVVVVNATNKIYQKIQAKFEIFDLNGKKIASIQKDTIVASNGLTECFTAKFTAQLPEVYLVRLTLADKNQIYSQNEYWKSRLDNGSFESFNNLPTAILKAKLVKQDNDKIAFQISNEGTEPAIGIKLNLKDMKTDKITLPAYFTDGYFTLLPGEKKQIEVELSSSKKLKYQLVAEGYNLKSMILTEFSF
jgi:hypothetical protein